MPAAKAWSKRGVLVAPDPDISWMSHYVGPTFVEAAGGDAFTLYITGRDGSNRSRVGRAHAVVRDLSLDIVSIERRPLFDLGELGCFDESGVSYPWIIDIGRAKLMYYVGWVAGGLARFQNFTGLAVSEDGGETFRRHLRVPILDRTDREPYGSGSCAVYPRNGAFEMMYTAFEPWGMRHGRMQPSYNIKLARSADGYAWRRDGETVIDFAGEHEYVIGKPMVLKDEGIYKLWYSHRGPAYRIGYAESVDGATYVRKDHLVGIDVSSSGWDSEMIEYGFVFRHGSRLFMVYNGNQFGKTGLGWAIQV
ncbi:MAG: hypothetical protein SFV21_14540 [Rhodospirillaceae bacterium]|nr:hypothetical protein [Rhodospirillaceae bacterium]